MATCRNCSKKGLLLRTNKQGVCKDCQPKVAAEIEKHSNVIYEEMHVHERSVEQAEKLAACDRLLDSAKTLLTYEDWGYETCQPPAKLVHDEYTGFRADLREAD